MRVDTGWKVRLAPNLGLNSLETPMFLASVGGTDPVAHVAFIADQGFAGVEDNFLKLRSAKDQERIGRALLQRGLAMGCFVANPGSWNRPLWVSRESDARAKLRADLDTSIESAQRTGGRVMTVLTGFDAKLPRSFQIAALIENLRRLAPAAERAGVVMGLEACNSWEYPMLFLNDVREAYSVAAAVDSPAVGVIFDVYHVQMMTGDVIRNLQRCRDRIVAVQIADNPGRTEPGTGEINWSNLFRALNQMAYEGLVELEHEIAEPGMEGERAALERLRAINALV
jgi:hydroxypyruvate isomerase